LSNLIIVSCYTHTPDIVLLEYLLTQLQEQTELKWQLANDMSGNIAIIDIDDTAGQELYQQISSQKKPPVIITLSTDTPEDDTQLHLAKPLHSDNFIALAKSVIQQYPDITQKKDLTDDVTSAVNAQRTSPPVKSDCSSAIKRPSHRRLYNLLIDESSLYQGSFKVTYNEISIIIDLSLKQFFCTHKLMMLSMMCKADINRLQIDEIPKQEMIKTELERTPRPLSELIWCCALLGSSGELIDGINENTPLHLKVWPDLKSLIHLPRHITLSAFMSKETATISEISAQTRIIEENIIDFVNACKVLNYLDKSLILPADNNQAAASPEDNNKAARPNNSNKQILIIDDSLIARKAAAKPLKAYGFDILEANDGFDALGKLDKILPDLIILDLIMPGIDGYKVVDLLKNADKFKHLPIIMVTSKDSLMDKVKGKMSDTDAYLTKPFKDDVLLKTVIKALEKHQSL